MCVKRITEQKMLQVGLELASPERATTYIKTQNHYSKSVTGHKKLDYY